MPFVTLSNSIQYIIGIDFGNGETSAAVCNLNDTNLPVDLKFMNNSTIATAISVNANGEVCLGFDTLNVQDSEQYGAYLKGRPSDLDNKPAQKELYKKFITEIYDNIKQAMQGEGKKLTPYNHLVFVACPSMSEDWDEDEKKKYAEFMAEECGLPILKHSVFGVEEYGVFRESRAAYVKYKGSDMAKNNEDNILVIDFGSSTVDMTYHSKSDKPIDKGYTTIGAQRVEEMMIEQCVSSPNVIHIDDSHRSVFKELYEDKDGKGWKEYIKLAVRKSKELYYEGNPRNVQITIDPVEITRNPQYPSTICPKIPRDVVDNDVLSGYKKEIKSCFDDFKNEYLQGKRISAIVLTGGASRMMWIVDIIKESFPDVKLYHPTNDKATSLLVSNGIAIAGRVEVKMIQMLRQLRSEISTIKIDGTFVDSITNSIVDKVIEIDDKVFAEIAAPDSEYDTVNKIQARFDSQMAVVEKWASDVISANYNMYYENCKIRLQNLCNSYFPGVDIAGYRANTLSTRGKLSSNVVIGKQRLMSLSMTASVLAINSALTILGALFIMYANFGGWIINFFIKIWNFLFGSLVKFDKYEYISLTEAVTNRGLKPDDILKSGRRKKMLKSYEENKAFLRADLRIKIKAVLNNEIDIDTTAKHIKMQVEDYVVNTVKDIRHLLR